MVSLLFVIEHLEPRVYPWCKLEYAHISSVVGKKHLFFTNTKNSFLKTIGKTSPQKISELRVEKPCVLDPEANTTLTPQLAKKYSTFIFGGILGDYPPRKRTQQELPLLYPRYNLGKNQMSTDTAVIVTHKILFGTPLEKLAFQNGIEIKITPSESIQLPYNYLLVDGKPILPRGLITFLKKRNGF